MLCLKWFRLKDSNRRKKSSAFSKMMWLYIKVRTKHASLLRQRSFWGVNPFISYIHWGLLIVILSKCSRLPQTNPRTFLVNKECAEGRHRKKKKTQQNNPLKATTTKKIFCLEGGHGYPTSDEAWHYFSNNFTVELSESKYRNLINGAAARSRNSRWHIHVFIVRYIDLNVPHQIQALHNSRAIREIWLLTATLTQKQNPRDRMDRRQLS